MEATVEQGPDLRVGVAQVVFSAEGTGINLSNGISPSLDGARFVAVRDLPTEKRLSIIQNWLATNKGDD